MHLLETLTERLGYPALKKIDPNTQEVIRDSSRPDEDRFNQAAIPAILIGLYKYSTTDEGAAAIVRGGFSPDWVKAIFGDHYVDVLQKIAAYGNYSEIDTAGKMNRIAVAAAQIINEETNSADNQVLAVKEFLASQRKNILPYLPAVLQMGNFLEDDTLDDRTNKMEGPISSMMQNIASGFSKADMDQKKEKL